MLFILQHCTNFCLYIIDCFFYGPLYESAAVLLILTVTIWKRVISSNILEVETPLLGPSPGTSDVPYGPVSRWSLCCSQTLSGFQDSSRKSFPVSSSIGKWPASLTARFPLFWTPHTFIVSAGQCLLMELRFSEWFSGVFPGSSPNYVGYSSIYLWLHRN